jgi:hypothetical protein
MSKSKKIKVKITRQGGYVMGDGKCPFDPDEFLIAIGDKLMEAKVGDIIYIDSDEVEAMRVSRRNEITNAPVKDMAYDGDVTKLVEEVCNELPE